MLGLEFGLEIAIGLGKGLGPVNIRTKVTLRTSDQ